MATVLTVLMLVSAVGLSCSHLSKAARDRERCRANLRMLWSASSMFAPEQTREFAPSLQALLPLAPDPEYYVCPATGHHTGDTNDVSLWSDYGYVSGLKANDPPACVLAFCPPEHHGGEGAHVLRVDGSVRWCPAEEFQKLTNDPALFFGIQNSKAIDALRSRTRLAYPKR